MHIATGYQYAPDGIAQSVLTLVDAGPGDYRLVHAITHNLVAYIKREPQAKSIIVSPDEDELGWVHGMVVARLQQSHPSRIGIIDIKDLKYWATFEADDTPCVMVEEKPAGYHNWLMLALAGGTLLHLHLATQEAAG